MNFSVLLKDEAILDLKEAYDWYEKQKIGLGSRFLDYVDFHLKKIQLNPTRFRHTRGQREMIMTTFPFKIVFHVAEDQIVVLAVLHQRRNPNITMERE